jgi:hypothetical protein
VVLLAAIVGESHWLLQCHGHCKGVRLLMVRRLIDRGLVVDVEIDVRYLMWIVGCREQRSSDLKAAGSSV